MQMLEYEMNPKDNNLFLYEMENISQKEIILLKKKFFFESNLQSSEEINDQAYTFHEDATKNSTNLISN